MECPNCKHATSNAALLQCSHCGESFERGLLEELGHIDYIKNWVDEHRADFGEYRAGLVQSRVAERKRKILKEIKGTVEAPSISAAPVPLVQAETPAPVALPIPVVPPAPAEVKLTPVAEVKPVLVKPTPVVIRAESTQAAAPARAATLARTSTPKPTVAPKPAAPPKPKRPPIDWRKVITDAATSGALLRALLYLGAFMIVISATVLVVRFWASFSQPLQLLFIASVPLTFYAGGWALRTRLQLIQAGTVLTGIGAVLVAVDFGAIYQFGGLAGRVNGAVYWLAVTLFCTALYAFTARRLKGEFFNYLTLLSGAGVLLTFTRLLNLPLDWSVASITASGALMAIAAGRVSKAHTDWQEILRASRYLAQILIPVSVMYIILLPIQPPMGHMLAFLFATIGYAVLAWQFPALIFAYAAIAASLGAIFYGLRVTELPIEWYATAASILAPGYIFIGQRAQRAKHESNIIQSYVEALNSTGLILIVLAALGGFITSLDKTPAGVFAMTLASLDLAICAYIFGSSLFTLFASSLFILPFSVAFGHWLTDAKILQATGWLTVGIGGLALAYIFIGAGLKKVPAHAGWLHAVGHVLAGTALFILPLDYLISPANWTHIPSLISLGIGIGIYLVSFALQNSGRHPSLNEVSNWLPYGAGKSIFLWPLGFLIPVWLVVAWAGYDLPKLWIGTALTVLDLIYIGIGQRLFKLTKEYRLPFHTYAYLLCALGILMAIPSSLSSSMVDRYPLLTALLITVASAAILARLYDRNYETIIASLLFIWPFQLSLEILKITGYTQPLAYVLLGSLAYASIAIYLKSNGKSREKLHHAPVFVVGYSLVAYAVIASIIGRSLDSYIPWIGVIVPLIATALLTFSASLFKADKYSSIWAWAGTLTFTIAFGQSLTLFKVPATYHALAWVGIAAFYMLFERTLFFNSQKEKRDIQKFWAGIFQQPWIIFAAALTALGLLLSLPDTFAAFTGTQLNDHLPMLLAQIAVVVLVIAAARLYQNHWLMFLEPFIAFLPATLFFVTNGKQIFGQALTTPQYALIWTALGIIHVIAGTVLDRAHVRYSHSLYLGGYIFLAWAVAWSVFERATLVWTLGFGILVSTASALLAHLNRHQTWDEFIQLLFGKSTSTARKTTRNAFQWLAAWTFPLWFVILLREINVSNSFAWLGLVVPPLVYLALALWFRRVDSSYGAPLFSAAQFYTAIGLLISVPTSINYLSNLAVDRPTLLAFMILQATAVIFYTASAWIFKSRGFAHISAWLSIIPVTMAWKFIDPAFTDARFAIPWLMWSSILLSIGFGLDKNKVRYSHGPYLAGYILISWAVFWSLLEQPILIWALGLWILASIASALLVHFHRHQTWEDLIGSLFGESTGIARTTTRNAFQWLATWTFPIWCVILLPELNAHDFTWLGLVVPPLAYLGLVLWFRRIDSTYTTPFFSAAQFYTIIGLLVSVPVTVDFFGGAYEHIDKNRLLAFILVQATAVVFYSASAWISGARGFAHVAAWLSIIPVTIAWRTYGFAFTDLQFVIPWLLWSTVLIGIGFALDKNKIRYSHGPYFAGYILAGYALAVSTTHRLTNIYALAITVSLALISHLIVHYGRHHSFEDFMFKFWYKTDETTRQIAATFFLFFATYAFPVLLTQILAHLEYPLAWRGVSLAIVAPLYIAIGLFISRSKSRGIATVPTWALYSAGYALTAIGAMVSFENEELATYVLMLNAVVYGVSAYIFQQAFWLYLSTILTPIIALLVLHQADRFESPWVAWIFITLAYIYLGIGQIFDRSRNATFMSPASKSDINVAIHPFAIPFYAPGFLLSAIALAVASSDRILAIQIYSAGVLLYALSDWLFRETLFIYPAAWLAAVPYYLAVTLTPLDVRWYGLAWLPLIVLYIAIGKTFFHKQKLAPLGQGMLVQWLTHPAIPFYLLAYALSVSMISLSYVDPLAITIAFGVAAIVYISSAFLFRTPGWIYASLFAAHMTLLTSITITPQGGEAYSLALPFHALTWVMALLGYGFSHRTAESDSAKSARTDDQREGPSEAFKLSLVERLLGHPWSRPFFVFALTDIIVWQSIALYGYNTTLTLASGHALLLALFSILWVEGALVYGAVGFGLLAVSAWMTRSGFVFSDAVAVFGGIGFGLYLLARLIEPISARFKSWTVWLAPLTNSAITLTALAVLINLPFIANHMTASAATLAFAGALYVTIAYRGRQFVLGYLGMALLEIAWVIVLFMNDVVQPQFYAIPGGLYFMGIAYLELQRNRRRYATGIEILGLGVLLVTSFVQSLNATGLPYFVLLMAEALLVLAWGWIQKRRIPFFTGIGTSVLNVLAQAVVLVSVHDINRWFVAFGVGLLIMATAIYIERSREQLRTYSRELSETLETWE